MIRGRLSVALLAAVASACTVDVDSGDGAFPRLEVSIRDFVEACGEADPSAMSTASGGSGMTKEYGFPFYRDTYEAELLLTGTDRTAFIECLAAQFEAAIERDGIRVSGRGSSVAGDVGLDRRSLLYDGAGMRGTLDLFVMPMPDGKTRVLALVTEQPHG